MAATRADQSSTRLPRTRRSAGPQPPASRLTTQPCDNTSLRIICPEPIPRPLRSAYCVLEDRSRTNRACPHGLSRSYIGNPRRQAHASAPKTPAPPHRPKPRSAAKFRQALSDVAREYAHAEIADTDHASSPPPSNLTHLVTRPTLGLTQSVTSLTPAHPRCVTALAVSCPVPSAPLLGTGCA